MLIIRSSEEYYISNEVRVYIDNECTDAIKDNDWTAKNKTKAEILKTFFEAINRQIQKIRYNRIAKQAYSNQSIGGGSSLGFKLTALKFNNAIFTNARIYCQEHRPTEETPRIIILCELLASKKQTKQTYRERSILKRIKGYEYQI